jgi:hypothetical protein
MNKTRWMIPLSMLALFVLLVAPAQAADGVDVSLTADRNELTVGEPVQLTLEVTHPAGYQVVIPKLGPTWGDLEVRHQSQTMTVANDDGTETTRQNIEVTLFNLGDFGTGEMLLTISDGAGQVFEVAVPSVPLTVVPTLAEEDNDLRDIKPQAGMTVPATWPWITGGVLLALGLAVGGWWAYRRWRGEPFLAPIADNRPPWQVAYDELARIEGLGLLEQGHFKRHYTLVTDCLRTYLECQFGLRAFDRTTSELKAVLRQSDMAPEAARRFLGLFDESDLVKFAKFTPDLNVARDLTDRTRRLVDDTRPQPQPELETFLGEDQGVTPVPTSQLSYQSRR